LIDDILVRDIVRLHPMRKPFLLKELLRLLAASDGSRTSFHKLSRVLNISLETVRDYVAYLESAFLVAHLEKWSDSLSDKTYAAKKLYLLDNGVKTLITGSGDDGAKAEAAVFAELRRGGIESGYFAESEREVDFVTGASRSPRPVEVKYVSSFDEGDKRYAGLRLFLRRFPAAKKAVIVTRSVDKEENINGTPLRCVPLWKFLLDPAAFL
jgi:predicted AAA+ superfamily ATPase